MPTHKSTTKRLRTSNSRRLRNRANRALMRSSIRSFRKAVADKAEIDRKVELTQLCSLLDVQARKGIIHRNKAARLKSRLTALTQK